MPGPDRELRGTPIREYDPDDLGERAYAALARLLDEMRADHARRTAEGVATTTKHHKEVTR